MKERFRILSLSGGGARGVFSAAVLCELQAALRARTGDASVRLVDRFDLIVGTSTGGLLALGLAFGKQPDELLEAYKRHAPRIFVPWWRNPRLLRCSPVFGPLYGAGALRAAVSAMVPPEKKLGDASCPVVLPAVRSEAGGITCLKTAHHESLYKDCEMNAIDAGLATAAAPVAFPSVRTAVHGELLDGGLFANTPILVGVVEAVRFFGRLPATIDVLSIGTTRAALPRRRAWPRGGLVEYGGLLRGRMLDLLWGCQRELALQASTLMLGPGAILHIDHEFGDKGYSMMDASPRALSALEDAGRLQGQRSATAAWDLCTTRPTSGAADQQR